jgi:hypothetical protein
MAYSNAWRTLGFCAAGLSMFFAGVPTPSTLPTLKVTPW